MEDEIPVGGRVVRSQYLEGRVEGREEGDFSVSGVQGPQFQGEKGGKEEGAELRAELSVSSFVQRYCLWDIRVWFGLVLEQNKLSRKYLVVQAIFRKKEEAGLILYHKSNILPQV